jgi:hypothetical protein
MTISAWNVKGAGLAISLRRVPSTKLTVQSESEKHAAYSVETKLWIFDLEIPSCHLAGQSYGLFEATPPRGLFRGCKTNEETLSQSDIYNLHQVGYLEISRRFWMPVTY